MPKPVLLCLAMSASLVGVAWLALAMETHWLQARGLSHTAPDAGPRRATAVLLRVAGVAALALSLWLCLRADHASMAALVWVMALAASAVVVALTLAWRPVWLAWLVGGRG